MTLDPVHFDGIAALVRLIGREVDDAEYDDLAARIWEHFLDPLRDPSGRPIVEPIEGITRGQAPIDDLAVEAPPFEHVHAIDAGTLNPTTFRNGVVVDIAQAAMGAVPTDLELHRSRSVVATVHTGDATVNLRDEWITYDEGYSRRRLFKAPRVDRFAEAVVHALALYRAEIEHAHWHADRVDELLVLDGPLYPRGLLRWEDRHPSLAVHLSEDVLPRRIVELYVRLVERFLDREVPVVGFVKNPASKLITRTLRSGDGGVHPPWSDDATFFLRLLDPTGGGADARSLRHTNWFLSRGGTDGTFAASGELMGLDRRREPAAYEVTFFVIYDPRDGLLYRVEAPYGVTHDDDVRKALTRQFLIEVATNRGPPAAVAKADGLARIGGEEKEALKGRIEAEWRTDRVRSFDDRRWGDLLE